jgi:predicted RNA binding protein YcfA (HicA-like mRNA interferase family)
MSKLPVISGKECMRALTRCGFYLIRQKGSHLILRNDDAYIQLVVPNHRTIDRGTLRAIIRQADLSVDDFVDLL